MAILTRREHDSDLFVLLLAETARGAKEVGDCPCVRDLGEREGGPLGQASRVHALRTHCACTALRVRPYPAARTPCTTLHMDSAYLNLRYTYSGSIYYVQVGSAYVNLREMLHHGAEWRQHELRFVAAEGGVLGAISASTDLIPCLAALAALATPPGVPGVVVAGDAAAGGAAAAAAGRAEPRAVVPLGEGEAASEGGEGASVGRRAAQGEAGGGGSEASVQAAVGTAVEAGRDTSAAARGVSALGLLTSGVLPPRRGVLPPLQPRPWAAAEPAAQAGGASSGDAGPGCGPAAAPPPPPAAAAAAPAAAAPVPAAAASVTASATRSFRSLFRVPSSELRVQVAPAPVPTQGLSPLPESPAARSPAAAAAAEPRVAVERRNANPDAAARSAVHRALANELEVSCAWHSKATGAGRRDSRVSRERRSSHGQVLPMG